MSILGMLPSVLWRYSALIAQYLIITGIAHRASVADAGLYFAQFGFVAVAFTVVGLGAPDGLVRELPNRLQSDAGARSRALVGQAMVGSVLSTLAIVALMLSIAAGLNSGFTGQSFLLAAWWLGYCLVFLLAQITVALGKPSHGSFLAYSVINVGYLCIQIPYLLLASTVSLNGILTAAVVSTYAAVLVSGAIAGNAWNGLPGRTSRIRGSFQASYRAYSGLVRLGFPMMTARLLQASLPWIPVWVLTIYGQPEAAAIYAAASRLVVLATSVIAALRFAMRPRIVLLHGARDWLAIVRLTRASSLLAGIPVVCGFAVLPFVGSWVVRHLLGEAYGPALQVLQILLIGVLAEAIGGLSDEILKMTGRTRVVMAALGGAVALELLGTFLLRPLGLFAIAGVTAAAFSVLYGSQLLWLARHTPIRIWSRKVPARVEEAAT